ncbi:MAG: hypothetical protein ABH986_01275 [archaeon]
MDSTLKTLTEMENIFFQERNYVPFLSLGNLHFLSLRKERKGGGE